MMNATALLLHHFPPRKLLKRDFFEMLKRSQFPWNTNHPASSRKTAHVSCRFNHGSKSQQEECAVSRNDQHVRRNNAKYYNDDSNEEGIDTESSRTLEDFKKSPKNVEYHDVRRNRSMSRVGENTSVERNTRLSNETSAPDSAMPIELSDRIREKLLLQCPLSGPEWAELKEMADKLGIAYRLFQRCIMDTCLTLNNFAAAKSYVDHLNTLGEKIHVVTQSKLLHLASNNVGMAGTELVSDTCTQILTSKTYLRDPTLTTVIRCLAATSRWNEAIELLKERQRGNKERGGPLHPETLRPIYDVAFQTALEHKDADSAKEILNLSMSQLVLPSSGACDSWFNYYKSSRQKLGTTKSTEPVSIAPMLDFYRKHWIHLPRNLVERIRQFYSNDMLTDWEGEFVYIPENGLCPHCHHHLESSSLPANQFEVMRKHFIHKISNMSDNFLQIHRREFPDFKNFLKRAYPFDVVVDGTAVASFFNQEEEEESDQKFAHDSQIHQLSKLVLPLLTQRKRVVVIASMNLNQRNDNLDYLRRKCNFFFTHSQHRQALLLVAALYGGNDLKLIARNFLEYYKPWNEDVEKLSHLRQWSFNHVLSFVKNEISQDIQLLSPVKFCPRVQMTASTVHVPCSGSEEPTIGMKLPATWLCLKKALNGTETTAVVAKGKKLC